MIGIELDTIPILEKKKEKQKKQVRAVSLFETSMVKLSFSVSIPKKKQEDARG